LLDKNPEILRHHGGLSPVANHNESLVLHQGKTEPLITINFPIAIRRRGCGGASKDADHDFAKPAKLRGWKTPTNRMGLSQNASVCIVFVSVTHHSIDCREVAQQMSSSLKRRSTRRSAKSWPAPNLTRIHRRAGGARDQDQHGKGAWRDNAFVGRLWRSVKYEEVYLHAYDSVSAARDGIGRYLDLNRRRPHSSLVGQTPDDAYFGQDNLPPIRLAA
jgi:hypothetical protein